MITRHFKMLIFTIILCSSIFSCEEDLLNIDIRDEIVGTWNVTESNNLKKSTNYYTVSISKSPADTSRVRISNFYEITGNVVVDVNGFKLSVPEQNISTFTVQGYGSISLNMRRIDWSYTVDYNNGFIDQVTAVYTKAK